MGIEVIKNQGVHVDYKKLSKKHAKQFDVQMWFDKFQHTKSIRQAWDNDHDELAKIKDNNFDVDNGMLKDVSDTIVSKNDLKRTLKYKDAQITGSDFFIDVIKLDNIYDTEQQILESEINFSLSQENIAKQIEFAKEDQSWYGLGWIKNYWDNEMINNVWQTGTPITQYIDTRRMYIDPSSTLQDLSDINYTFHVITLSVEDAKMMFEGKDDMIDRNVSNAKFEYGESGLDYQSNSYVHVIIAEYKRIIKVKKVRVKDTDTGLTEVLAIDDEKAYNELIAQTEELGSMEVSEIFNVKEDAVFTFAMFDDSAVTLSEPIYVGPRLSYIPICGERLANDPYPRGLAYWLKDLEVVSTIAFSVATMLTTKALKTNMAIQEGAIVNEEEFLDERQNLNAPPAHISEEWAMRHPGVIPIQNLNENINLMPMQTITAMLTESMQSYTGATAPAMGESKSGDSGIKVAQLQNAAGVYHKWDENNYHLFLRRIGTWYLYTIPENRDYDHDVMVNDMKGNKLTVSARGGQFHPEQYRVDATVESSPEAIRQQKVNQAMQLYQMGAYSMMRLLKDFGIVNPEQIVNEAKEEQGILQAEAILKENPELMKFVIDYKEKQIGTGQDGSAGLDVSNKKK